MLRGLPISVSAALAACGNARKPGGQGDAGAEVREASEAVPAAGAERRGGDVRPRFARE